MAITRTIPVAAHGRYLVEAPASGRVPPGVLIGFHGYGENAEIQLERLRAIPGSDAWVRVSVQGLHRFYRGRTQEVVASWMTRQDRELMIADNTAYVLAILGEVLRETKPNPVVVFAGFSQGVAMALRAACASSLAAAVIALGGDIPPEIDARSLAWLRGALVSRGIRDDWYTGSKFDGDLVRLRESGVTVRSLTLDAGHEWTSEFSQAAGAFLATLL